jgi:hypothetical protein
VAMKRVDSFNFAMRLPLFIIQLNQWLVNFSANA